MIDMKDRLVKLAEEYSDIYHEYSVGFCGMNNGGKVVHLTEEGIKELFPETKFETESFNNKYDKISTIYDGIGFMALVEKEEK